MVSTKKPFHPLAKHTKDSPSFLQAKDGKIRPFDLLCQELGSEHRTTQFRHPWTIF